MKISWRLVCEEENRSKYIHMNVCSSELERGDKWRNNIQVANQNWLGKALQLLRQ